MVARVRGVDDSEIAAREFAEMRLLGRELPPRSDKKKAQNRPMNPVVKLPHPGGRPRIYDREALLEAFEAYIETTDIPIVVEFTTQAGITRDLIYSWPEVF
jgi:hypothetical protein